MSAGRTTTPGNSVSMEMRGWVSIRDRMSENSKWRLEDQTDLVRTGPWEGWCESCMVLASERVLRLRIVRANH